jgi:hypothetical protein
MTCFSIGQFSLDGDDLIYQHLYGVFTPKPEHAKSVIESLKEYNVSEGMFAFYDDEQLTISYIGAVSKECLEAPVQEESETKDD